MSEQGRFGGIERCARASPARAHLYGGICAYILLLMQEYLMNFEAL